MSTIEFKSEIKGDNLKPLVSVIMASYNSELYIRQSIESILQQTYSNLELLVIDNRSSDATQEIVRKMSVVDPRIKLIILTNPGIFPIALNEGIKISKGTWISICDSDDIALPEKLEKQILALEGNLGSVYCGTNAQIIDSAGKLISSHMYPTNSEDLVRRLANVHAFPPHSSALYLKEAAVEVGLYNDRYLASEDIEFQRRISTIGRIINVGGDPLVRIRKHSNNLSAASNAAKSFKFLTLGLVSSDLRGRRKISPDLQNEKIWLNFQNFIENQEKYSKASEEYVSYCEVVEKIQQPGFKKLFGFLELIKHFFIFRNLKPSFSNEFIECLATGWITFIDQQP